MDSNNFSIRLTLKNSGGETKEYPGKVEFAQNPDDYGNGFYMGITCGTEPFGTQGYDIRYDKDFKNGNKLPYIVQFFAARFTGKNGSWKLVSIEVTDEEA